MPWRACSVTGHAPSRERLPSLCLSAYRFSPGKASRVDGERQVEAKAPPHRGRLARSIHHIEGWGDANRCAGGASVARFAVPHGNGAPIDDGRFTSLHQRFSGPRPTYMNHPALLPVRAGRFAFPGRTQPGIAGSPTGTGDFALAVVLGSRGGKLDGTAQGVL